MRSARTLIPTLLFALIAGTSNATGPAPVAPDFSLPARDGGEVRLSELKGQVVMINFWATWCGPCRQEMPLLQQIHAKYEPLGFTMLGVNVEPDSAAAQQPRRAFGSLSFPTCTGIRRWSSRSRASHLRARSCRRRSSSAI